MSLASLFIHACDIKRNTPGVQDGYGTPVASWANVYTSESCRFQSAGAQEIRDGARVVISDWKMFFDNSITISERDRIDNILLASSGAVVDSATFEVLKVQPKSDGVREHHLEVLLQKVV